MFSDTKISCVKTVAIINKKQLKAYSRYRIFSKRSVNCSCTNSPNVDDDGKQTNALL